MELKIISDQEYAAYLESKQNVALQMQLPMIEVYRLNGWSCTPVGLFTTDYNVEVTGSVDSYSSLVVNSSRDKLVGVAMLSGKPLKFAGMYYTCQYGPYLESYEDEYVSAFFKQVIQLLKKMKCSKFSCNPNLVATRYDVTGVVTDQYAGFNQQLLLELGYQKKDLKIDTNGQIDMRYMYKKDMNVSTVEQLRSSYKPRTRREVNNASNNLVEVVQLDFENIDRFTDLMKMSGEKHGFRVHGSEYYKTLKQQFGDDAIFLIARLNLSQFEMVKATQISENQNQISSYNGDNRKGRITKLEEVNGRLENLLKLILNQQTDDGYLYLTAGVYIKTADQLIHFLSGNNPEFGKFNSSSLMQDYAMQIAIEQKLPVFNMYGVKGTFESADSVFNFKVGFGGYVEETIGTFDIKLAPIKLQLVELIKKLSGKK